MSIATADKNAHTRTHHEKNPLKMLPTASRIDFISGNLAKVFSHSCCCFWIADFGIFCKFGWEIAYKRINKYYDPPSCSCAQYVCICISLGLCVQKKNKILFGQNTPITANIPTFILLVALQNQAILIIYEHSASLCVERICSLLHTLSSPSFWFAFLLQKYHVLNSKNIINIISSSNKKHQNNNFFGALVEKKRHQHDHTVWVNVCVCVCVSVYFTCFIRF